MPNTHNPSELELDLIKRYSGYQETFNSLIDAYIELANQWTKEKFRHKSVEYVTDYSQYNTFESSDFHNHYESLMRAVNPYSLPTPGDAFKLVESSFDYYGTIPKFNRPNSIPYNLPGFIDAFNSHFKERHNYLSRNDRDTLSDFFPIKEIMRWFLLFLKKF